MIVDLFAGPGGFDTGAKAAGLDPIGIEIDHDACATRAAAGIRTVRADVRSLELAIGEIVGLLGSPPCPAFSAAGNREGTDEIPLLAHLLDNEPGTWIDWRPAYNLSPDAVLTAEPFRWADRYKPRWVILEQVPPVLPVWEAGARWLNKRGYDAWAGVLDAADYGVPQNRKRAFLLASLDEFARPPARTHMPPPEQTPLFPPELPTWVTMADALGMDGTLSTGCDWREDKTSQTRPADRPSPTVSGKSATGQWHLHMHEHGREPSSIERPAGAVTGKAGRNWVFRRPATTVAGDSRVWPPGHKINADDIARLGEAEATRRYGDRAGSEAVRLDPWQAGVLQSFPPDYPWRGTKTSQAQQVGNAVPPLLAQRVIEAVAG